MSDEDYMRAAVELAREAGANDEVPVGAVVVLNGEIVGRGIASGEFRAMDVRGAVMSLIFPMIMLCLHKHSLGACMPEVEMMDPHAFTRQHVEIVLNGLRGRA